MQKISTKNHMRCRFHIHNKVSLFREMVWNVPKLKGSNKTKILRLSHIDQKASFTHRCSTIVWHIKYDFTLIVSKHLISFEMQPQQRLQDYDWSMRLFPLRSLVKQILNHNTFDRNIFGIMGWWGNLFCECKLNPVWFHLDYSITTLH